MYLQVIMLTDDERAENKYNTLKLGIKNKFGNPSNYSMAAVVVNGYLMYICGSRCYLFNPRNKKVEEIASLPNTVQEIEKSAATMFSNSICSTKNDVFTCIISTLNMCIDQVLKYNFESNQWNILGP